MSSPVTVLEAVQRLQQDGYTANIAVLPDGTIRCGSCGDRHAARDALVDRVYRYEGVSDPDDETIVFGVRCPICGMQGVIVSAFGPNAEPTVMESLVLLDDRFRQDL
jgi:hypothetical protein